VSAFPSRAKVVIIGAGIVGNSLAYHLAKLGWKEIVQIDKGPLPNPGGSTGHASNFLFLVDHNKEMAALTNESADQYIDWGVYTACGGIEVARTEERMEELRRRMASSKSWGVEGSRLISPAEIKELVPFINEKILLGGFYNPKVGVCDSLRFGTLCREKAQEMGALQSFANTEVSGFDIQGGRVRAVHTSRGTIEAEYVVIACGVWSAQVAEMAGAFIPLTPVVHQMADYGPVPLFEKATKAIEYPIIRDMDTFMYERQDGIGFEVGSYAHRSILHDPEEIPSVEKAVLSPTEFPFTQDDFDPQLEDALELFPEILGDEKVGQKYACNGLISLTPDGMPVLGETPEVKGLWSAAAVWVKEGPAVGQCVAEWMVKGESHIDLHYSDISRFHPHQKTRAHTKARAFESFPKTYGIVHPAEQYASDRPLRKTPMYDVEKSLGAVFYEMMGWERAQWFESNAPLVQKYGVKDREHEWDRRWWSPISVAEHLAMRENAGVFDLSSFVIFDVVGKGALDCVQKVAMRQMDVPVGRVVYTPVLSPSGGFKSDLTIMRLADDVFRVVTGAAHGMADLKWFRDHAPADAAVDPPEADPRGHVPRGLQVRHLPADRDRQPGRPRQPDQLRGRARLGALRPDGAGRAPLLRGPRGGQARGCDPLRDLRLRRLRPAREVLPGARRRARDRVQRRRGRDAATEGEGGRLRREGGLPGAGREGAGRADVHAHGRRPQLEGRDQALPARARADRPRGWHAAHRQPWPPLVRDERGDGAVGREVPPHGVPADGARGRREEALRGVHERALPGDGRLGEQHPGLRPREPPGPGVGAGAIR
jgi:glycine/D-amino acid oxidase-like deaminating enzyme